MRSPYLSPSPLLCFFFHSATDLDTLRLSFYEIRNNEVTHRNPITPLEVKPKNKLLKIIIKTIHGKRKKKSIHSCTHIGGMGKRRKRRRKKGVGKRQKGEDAHLSPDRLAILSVSHALQPLFSSPSPYLRPLLFCFFIIIFFLQKQSGTSNGFPLPPSSSPPLPAPPVLSNINGVIPSSNPTTIPIVLPCR